MVQRRGVLWLSAAVLGSLLLPSAARAQPAQTPVAATAAASPLTIDSLATMLTNMGYEVSQPGAGKPFTITVHGQYDVTITFVLSNSGNVTMYVYLQSYTPEELAKLDMAALLQSNDVWVSYFTLGKPKDDYNLYLQRILPAAAVSPVTIRATIENLQTVTYQTNATWNKRAWK